jgi:hypothetical protein
VVEEEEERERQLVLRARQRQLRRRNKAQQAARLALAQCSQVGAPTIFNLSLNIAKLCQFPDSDLYKIFM